MSKRVTIVKEVVYEPTSDDDSRCFGQLCKRASKTEQGVGPIEHYFKVGRTPTLKDGVADSFVKNGFAVPFIGEEVTVLSSGAMLQMMAAPTEQAVK